MTREQLDRAVAMARVIAHPARLEILKLAAESTAGVSAASTFRRLRRSESGTGYHFREMVKDGALRQHDTEPGRGAARKAYEITPFGQAILKWVDGVPERSSER